MTRIRTWVIAATTQCTNHYTITAVHISHIEFQVSACIFMHYFPKEFNAFLVFFQCQNDFSRVFSIDATRNAILNENESSCQGSTCAHVEIEFRLAEMNSLRKTSLSVGDIAQW